MDAQERTQLRSEVFPLSPNDTLRHRGTVLSYDRRTYRDGLRREPILVYSGDGIEAHYDKAGSDVLIVTSDGDEYFVTPDATSDEKGNIPFSK